MRVAGGVETATVRHFLLWYGKTTTFSLDNPFDLHQTSPEVAALTNGRFHVTRFPWVVRLFIILPPATTLAIGPLYELLPRILRSPGGR